MSANKPSIVFFGTPEFASVHLRALSCAQFSIQAVISQPDTRSPRGVLQRPRTAQLATELHLPLFQPTGKKELERVLSSLRADIFVVVAYGRILPGAIIHIPTRGTINVHASLLPCYRGSSPIQTAILNGDGITGVTIMLIDEELDHGPILAQREISIASNDTSRTLHERLAVFGANMLTTVLVDYFHGRLTPLPQDHLKATYTKLIVRSDGCIDWNVPTVQIERKIRAYDPWPGAFSFFNGKRLKILNAAMIDNSTTIPKKEYIPGTLIGSNHELLVKTNNGFLKILTVQIEGRKSQTSYEFIHGYQNSLAQGIVLRSPVS